MKTPLQRFRSPFISTFLVVLFAHPMILFTGCSHKENNSQPYTITVGYMPIAECLPLFVAMEQGYFTDEEIQIKMIQFSGGAPTLEALGAGSVDVGFSNLVSLIFAVSGGHDFVSVWGATIEDPNHVLHGILVEKNSPIENASGLRNKAIAVNTLKNIDELLLRQWLEDKSVPPDQVKLLEVPFPRMPSVLKNGDVDAIAVVEPFLTYTINKRIGRLLGNYFIDINNEVCVTSYCASRRWSKSHQTELENFQSAMNKAVIYCQEHENEARKVLTKYTNLTVEQASETKLPIFSDKKPSIESIKFLCKAMTTNSWLQNPIKVEKLLYGDED